MIQVWRSTYYAAEVTAAANMVSDASLKSRILKVAEIPTFTWFDTMAKVADLPGYLKAAGTEILQIVVYDLPNRDCHANAVCFTYASFVCLTHITTVQW